VRFLVTCLLFCLPMAVHSQTRTDRILEQFYVTGLLDFQNVTVENGSFDQTLAGVSVGYWLWDGIGVEGELTGGFSDDSIFGLTLDVPVQASVNVRLESPPSGGLSAFFQFGFAHTEIESRISATASAGGLVTTSLTGPRAGIGLALKINRWLVAEAGFSGLFYDDDADSTLFRLGLRFSPGRLR